MKLKIYLSLLLFSFLSGMVSQGAEHPKREFRGAWIHTVGQSRYMEMNRDAMQDYFDQMLDSLQHTGINAVISKYARRPMPFIVRNLNRGASI